MTGISVFETQSKRILSLLAERAGPVDSVELASLVSLPAAQVNRVLYKLKSKALPEVKEVRGADGIIRHEYIGLAKPSTAKSRSPAATPEPSAAPKRDRSAGRQIEARVELAIEAIKALRKPCDLEAIAKKMKLPIPAAEITLFSLREGRHDNVKIEGDAQTGFIYHYVDEKSKKAPRELGTNPDTSEPIVSPTQPTSAVVVTEAKPAQPTIGRDILTTEIYARFNKPATIDQAAKALGVPASALQPIVTRLTGQGFLKSDKLMGTPVFRVAKPLQASLQEEIAITKSAPAPVAVHVEEVVASETEPSTVIADIEMVPPGQTLRESLADEVASPRSRRAGSQLVDAGQEGSTEPKLSKQLVALAAKLERNHQQMTDLMAESTELLGEMKRLLNK